MIIWFAVPWFPAFYFHWFPYYDSSVVFLFTFLTYLSIPSFTYLYYYLLIFLRISNKSLLICILVQNPVRTTSVNPPFRLFTNLSKIDQEVILTFHLPTCLSKHTFNIQDTHLTTTQLKYPSIYSSLYCEVHLTFELSIYLWKHPSTYPLAYPNFSL